MIKISLVIFWIAVAALIFSITGISTVALVSVALTRNVLVVIAIIAGLFAFDIIPGFK